MFKEKIEYKLSANTMVILTQQQMVDGKLCDMEGYVLGHSFKKSGIIRFDVKSGLSLQLSRPENKFTVINATGPVVSVRKDGNKIFIETKDSGVSAHVIHRVQIKYSMDEEFKKYLNFE